MALENQLNEQEVEAKNALQQWQDSYTELEERLVSLEGSTQSDDSTLALEELRFQVESKNDELNVAKKRIDADAVIVKQWEGKTASGSRINSAFIFLPITFIFRRSCRRA